MLPQGLSLREFFAWWGVGKIVGDKGVKLNFLRVRFVYICRRKARKCGGLDVEAAGRQAEVQKGRERVNGLVYETERRQEVSYEEEN